MRKVAWGTCLVALVALWASTPVGKVLAGHFAAAASVSEDGAVAVQQPAKAAVDQEKLRTELEMLGVKVDRFGELMLTADALTDEGDIKPGIAKKLTQLEGVHTANAVSLPAFAASAGRAIAAIPGLTRVTLWHTNATDAAVAALGDCPSLEVLRLSNGNTKYPVISNAGLSGLAKLKNVTTLECRAGTITSAGLSAILGFKKLLELDLNGCPLDDDAAPHLAKLTTLTEMNLGNTKMTGAGVRQLKGLSKLRALNVDGLGLTDVDAKVLAAMKGLQTLSLNSNKITDAGLVPLAELPELKDLSIGDMAITDAGAKILARTKSLAKLDVADTKITDDGIVELARLPKLRWLVLIRLPLTDRSLEALTKTPDLVMVWLAGNKFTPAGLAKFAAARPKVNIFK